MNPFAISTIALMYLRAKSQQKQGSLASWSSLPLFILPSYEKQVKTASLLAYIRNTRDRMRLKYDALDQLMNSLHPRVIQGELGDVKEILNYVGSFNRQYTLDQIATVKKDFPDADFWLQARGSRTTIGQVWRKFTTTPQYGKKAAAGSKYDIGIKVKPEFLDKVYPPFLADLFEYYHRFSNVWQIYGVSGTVMHHLRIKAVRTFPISLSDDAQGSSNTTIIPSYKNTNRACWRYNVLTRPGGLDVNARDIGKSYPAPRMPFEVVALENVVPHDDVAFSQSFRKDFQQLRASKKKLEKKYGAFKPKTNVDTVTACPSYTLTFPSDLRKIEGNGVFVHLNRHKSSFVQPLRTYYKEGDDQPIVFTKEEKSSLALPERGVRVGIRGQIMNPKNLPKNKQGEIDWASASYIFFTPFEPYWRKLTKRDRAKIERGEKVNLSKKPRLIRADYALLANQIGSRLPYVIVWGGEFE